LFDFNFLNWFSTLKNFYGLHFQNDHHNTAKIQHCSFSKVAFNLFFKPVVSGRFGRLHNHILLFLYLSHRADFKFTRQLFKTKLNIEWHNHWTTEYILAINIKITRYDYEVSQTCHWQPV
jgi:hypothetical protein